MIKKLAAKAVDDHAGCPGGGGGRILTMVAYPGYPVQSSGLHERVGISLKGL